MVVSTENYTKLKLAELDRRISELEQNTYSSTFGEVFFHFTEPLLVKTTEREFALNAFKDGTFTFSGTAKFKLSSDALVKVCIYTNDVLSHEFTLASNIEFPYMFGTALHKGVNKVKITFSALAEFQISAFKIHVLGSVNNVNTKSNVSVLTTTSIDYVLHKCNTNFKVYSYTSKDSMVELFSYNGVNSAQILGIIQNVLHIVVVDEYKQLKVLKYNLLNGTILEDVLNVNGIVSACGYKTEQGFTIFYCYAGEVYYFTYSSSLEISQNKLGKSGILVYAEPDVEGALVIVDKLNNAKFVTL